MLWDEVLLAKVRINAYLASQTLLFQLAVGSMFSKESAEEFTKVIKRLI
jgi:hypothetical protein